MKPERTPCAPRARRRWQADPAADSARRQPHPDQQVGGRRAVVHHAEHPDRCGHREHLLHRRVGAPVPAVHPRRGRRQSRRGAGADPLLLFAVEQVHERPVPRTVRLDAATGRGDAARLVLPAANQLSAAPPAARWAAGGGPGAGSEVSRRRRARAPSAWSRSSSSRSVPPARSTSSGRWRRGRSMPGHVRRRRSPFPRPGRCSACRTG